MTTPIQSILAVAGRVRTRSGCLHMLDLLCGLAARGSNVSLLCAEAPSDLGAREVGFPVLARDDVLGRWPFLRAKAVLEGIMERQKIQVVHVHGCGLGPAVRRFLRSARFPVVFTPHAAASERRELSEIQLRSTRVIALSEYLREGLVNRGRVPREKIQVVPPGIEPGLYEPALPPADRLPVVGVVAPMEPGRGHSVFLDAVKKLLNAGKRAEFIVAGDGPEERPLRRQAAAQELDSHVTFVTRLRNYREVISALDILVRPAVTGGLGYTVLEAMALGKAVVATATGGIPEMIEEGRTGLMISKGDPDVLAATVGGLLDHPERAEEMGRAARRSVAERFSMDRLVYDTLSVYQEAADAYSRTEALE